MGDLLEAPTTNWLFGTLSSLAFPAPAMHLIASTNDWLLPMLPSSTKTSLGTQIGCGKCLGY